MTSYSNYDLISPDTYAYLDDTKPEDCLYDPMLEEQEELEDILDEDEEESPIENKDLNDDSDAYSGTLFDFDDDDLDDSDNESEVQDDKLMFEEDDDDNIVIGIKEEVPAKKEEKRSELLEDICAFCTDRYNDIYKYIKSCSEEDARTLNDTIYKTRDAFLKDGKDKLFSVPDKDISIAVINDNADPMLYTQRLEFVAANMILKGRGFWNLLLLVFKENGELKDAKFVAVSRSAFSEGEWRIANNMAYKMKEKINEI